MESCLEFKFTIFPLDACLLSRFSHVRLSTTLWNVACQAPLSVRILQARILECVANTGGIEPRSLTLQANSL